MHRCRPFGAVAASVAVLFNSNRAGIHQMYAYRLADGTTMRISTDATTNSQFGNFENVPK